MINAILKGLLSLITNFVTILLKPINDLIVSLVPNFQGVLNVFGNAINILSQFMGWIVDSTLLNSEVISFLILLLIMMLTVSFSLRYIKLAINWIKNFF